MLLLGSRQRTEYIKYGIKTALAALLSYFLASLTDPDLGFWAVISAVIVMQRHVAASLQMCGYRLVGTAIGAVMAMAALYIFPPTDHGRLIGFLITVGLCVYLKRYTNRFSMAAITVTIVMLAPQASGDYIHYGLFRVAEIAIGVCSTFIVALLIWPHHASAELKERLQEQFTRCADKYDIIVNSFMALKCDSCKGMLVDLEDEIHHNRELFRGYLRHERLFVDDDSAMLDIKIETLVQSVEHLHAMLHVVHELHDSEYCIIMEAEIRKVVKESQDIMRAIGRNVIPDTRKLKQALFSADKRLESLRADGMIQRISMRDMMQIISFYHSAQQLGEDLLISIEKQNKYRRV
ncbi:FUSC family protein [Halodesulfovibrio marinisediminis]|uniref:Fusaric acid resistance protein family protein n=1 Tax=Halodesulfovibrio marinisediminis DSM 17456 TaxID=1121457 RepID=A0A1N6FAQ3_9BACT|nr:FUSC family protein [Halodesulfovibrio marinisediminis]SIN92353.1 Fusaric acid resistance protein family protein [Halodesulfovibrio marinisediminis DSM 17456]